MDFVRYAYMHWQLKHTNLKELRLPTGSIDLTCGFDARMMLKVSRINLKHWQSPYYRMRLLLYDCAAASVCVVGERVSAQVQFEFQLEVASVS